MSLQPTPKPDLLFVVSMDTEEEWDWSGPFPQGQCSVTNASKVPVFQEFCDSRGIRPTYFVDYAVAADTTAASALRPIVETDRCEIGAHLHPWANPPYDGETGELESHVVNLPIAQTEAKLDALITQLQHAFGVAPNAFRTGRWGVNGEILSLLHRKGFGIDSSMYPLFKNEYFDCERTPLKPYWPDFSEPMDQGRQRDILEFPVTVGFNHGNRPLTRGVYNTVSQPVLEPLRLVGALWQSRLLRKLYLSPEVMSGQDMLPLVDVAIAKKLPVLHMFLHSSSLLDHSEGMLSTANAMEVITQNISTLVDYAESRANLTFCTISEAATLIRQRSVIAA
ncbi:polysaccharide deacetylase family protein [bacterium]|nr:polysaccharide deacetylase family protein [bacterium]